METIEDLKKFDITKLNLEELNKTLDILNDLTDQAWDQKDILERSNSPVITVGDYYIGDSGISIKVLAELELLSEGDTRSYKCLIVSDYQGYFNISIDIIDLLSDLAPCSEEEFKETFNKVLKAITDANL